MPAALAPSLTLRAGPDALALLRERGLQVVPSDANFVLLGRFADSAKVWQAVLDRGVLIRDVGLPGWLRVTAGTEAETTAFLDALAGALDLLGPTALEPTA